MSIFLGSRLHGVVLAQLCHSELQACRHGMLDLGFNCYYQLPVILDLIGDPIIEYSTSRASSNLELFNKNYPYMLSTSLLLLIHPSQSFYGERKGETKPHTIASKLRYSFECFLLQKDDDKHPSHISFDCSGKSFLNATKNNQHCSGYAEWVRRWLAPRGFIIGPLAGGDRMVGLVS